MSSSGVALTRRDFVKAGGALVVMLGLPARPGTGAVEAAATTLDPAKLASWLELKADGSIVARTGKTETGTSASAYYAQVIAEELDVEPSAITLVMGHSDETPDGGVSAGFLMGAANLRKVAAYTRQALLGLAAERLGVPAASVTVSKGIVTGGGQRVSYADLVKGRQLELTIPVSGGPATIDPSDPIGIGGLLGLTVTGNPPTKPVAQYSVVGTSYPRPGVREIVSGTAVYGGDIVVPGMLHARMVRPATLGSTLIAAGKVDRKRFPTAEVVVRGNLVAVVSPDEWEAVQAARAVAGDTRWTDWSGLPGSDNVTPLMRREKWMPVGSRGDAAKVDAGLSNAAKTISATYEQPTVRHAPIGAFVAVADVRADGVTVWAQTSQSQGARAHLAHMLGVPMEKVVVRWVQGAGQYGRTTNGGDSAMADAAILSRMLGKPVRVQWTVAEDLAWSSVSPAWVADVTVGLDANGNIAAFKSDWYSPHYNDARMLGALLAGMPGAAPFAGSAYPGSIRTVWPYDKVPGVLEQAFFMPNIGAASPYGGLRGNIMRTPRQREQNFALEAAINEAAAAADADPIEFRIRHTSDARLIEILRATADAAGWKPRPSPNAGARRTGHAPLRGRGVGVIIRSNSPWVGIAEVEVTPGTGVVKVTQLAVGVDVGKVMNPAHLKAMLEGGAVMGVGEALFEEVTFDRSKVTSTDWTTYRIPTMADIPDIKTVFVSHDDRGINGGGEAANGVSPIAIVAAFFDATGVHPRRIPLTPAYVKSLLKS